MRLWAIGWTWLLLALVWNPATAEPDNPGDWPSYNRDLAGLRYSPLRQVSRENVGQLELAWSYRFQSQSRTRPGYPTTLSQATPLAVQGRLYLPAGQKVVALSGQSGLPLWERPFRLRPLSHRGVAYWAGKDGQPDRIFVTVGTALIALDAKTGEPAREFGKDGYCPIPAPYIPAPTVVGETLLLGATVGERVPGEAGDTVAISARTGERLWTFHNVPRPGEKGNETWGEGWRSRSGTNVWAFSFTADTERGIAYLPISSPATDYWGGDRPGDNLFGNSVVAVKLETGEYLWHFQTVHHDLWDTDLPAPPSLVDLELDGKKVPALLQPTKAGLVFILNRVTGEPIFGVEERPVPAGDVPGEWYSPTQPIPIKPKPLARTRFSQDDLVRAEDTSPEHAQAARRLWEDHGLLPLEGLYQPFLFHQDGEKARSTLQLPGGRGGIGWGGFAVDPTTNLSYVNVNENGVLGWMEKRKPDVFYSFNTTNSTHPYERSSLDTPGPFRGFLAGFQTDQGRALSLPCLRPPWCHLIALDANTGEVAWKVPLGITEGLPKEKQLTGASLNAGPMVTAGGLVFIGATTDRRFRAFDARTGEQLWQTELGGVANANPITYLGDDGQQYVAIVAEDTLYAFRLNPDYR